MHLYREIDFEHEEEITEQLLAVVRDLNPDLTYSVRFQNEVIEQRVPRLYEQFQRMGLELDVFREFCSPPGKGAAIHKDGTAQYPKSIAINWPLENCAGTKMIWWDTLGLPPSFFTYENIDATFGHFVPLYAEADCHQLDTLELVRPTVLNVGIHHSVTNPQQLYRRMVSFRFQQDPFYLLL